MSQELLRQRTRAATDALDNYVFPVPVESLDGWEWSTPGDEMTRVVYLEGENGAPSVKSHFTVRFEKDSATPTEIYCMLNGNIIGGTPAKGSRQETGMTERQFRELGLWPSDIMQLCALHIAYLNHPGSNSRWMREARVDEIWDAATEADFEELGLVQRDQPEGRGSVRMIRLTNQGLAAAQTLAAMSANGHLEDYLRDFAAELARDGERDLRERRPTQHQVALMIALGRLCHNGGSTASAYVANRVGRADSWTSGHSKILSRYGWGHHSHNGTIWMDTKGYGVWLALEALAIQGNLETYALALTDDKRKFAYTIEPDRQAMNSFIGPAIEFCQKHYAKRATAHEPPVELPPNDAVQFF